MAMPRCAGGRSLTTSPSKVMVPPVTSSRPAMRRSNVDFPQPEGPTTTTNSPEPMSRFTSLITSVVPNAFLTPLSVRPTIWLLSLLTLDPAGGQPGDNLALEDKDESDQRQGDDHRSGHDDAPRY